MNNKETIDTPESYDQNDQGFLWNIYESPEIQFLIEEHGEEKIKEIIRKRKKFYLYFDNFPNLYMFSNEDLGMLFRNIFAFEKGQNVEKMDKFVKYAFTYIQPRIIDGLVACITESINNSINGSKGGKAKAEKNKIPTKEEFIEACIQKGKDQGKASQFYDLYKESEWKNMDNWQQACNLV